MPFCPNCRDEYRPGFTWCADCNVELVDELPPEPEEAGEPPVVVYETYSQPEAEVVRAKLEFFGIPAALSGDLALRGLYSPMGVGTFGAIRILVPADQADHARQILEEQTLS